MSLTAHVYSPWLVTAGKRWWDALSPEERDAVEQSARAARDFERRDSRASTQKALEFLKEQGMKVVTFDPQDAERLRASVQASALYSAYRMQLERIRAG